MKTCSKPMSNKCFIKEADCMNKEQLSLSEIVKCYKKIFRPNNLKEKEYFFNKPSLINVIKIAPSKSTNNQKHPHQYRINKQALETFTKKLLSKIDSLKNSKTFKELHKKTCEIGNNEPGIGKLTCYDTATRIGYKLCLYPEYVYLHAGTKDGAKKLLKSNYVNKLTIPKSFFPKEFEGLSCDEIEDILCIFKNRF